MARRAAPSGSRGRHRLRGQVAEGAADAGARLGATRTVVVGPERATLREAGRADERSTTTRSSLGSRRELAISCAVSRAPTTSAGHDARRLGRPAPRPRRAGVRRPARSDRRDPARDQPRAVARCGEARGRGATSSCFGHAARLVARSGDGQPEDGDRRRRARGGRARDRLALDAVAVPARRGERRRDAAPPLPLARPPAREAAAQPPPARAMVGIIRVTWRRRGSSTSRRRSSTSRRPRVRATSSCRAGSTRAVLRAAPEPADPQAADDDRRVRPLLPDRDLLPGRGPPRRSRAGAHAARRRDELPGPGGAVRADGGDVRRDLARLPRRGDRDAVAADDLRGGRPSLRLRQARHAVRPRARGRDGAHARLAVRRLRGRRRGALPPRAEDVLACGARGARGGREGARREGARVPRARRGRRGPLADREVPLRAGAGGPRAGGGGRCSSPRTRGRRRHVSSATCACTSVASWA